MSAVAESNENASFSEKVFKFEWKRDGITRVLIETTLRIPLTVDLNEQLALFYSVYRVPVFARDELKTAYKNFVNTETGRFYDEQSESVLGNTGEKSKDLNGNASAWTDVLEEKHSSYAPAHAVSNDDIFREAYQSLLQADFVFVKELLKKESEFAKEVQTLIKERDWEIDRFKKEHSSVIDNVVSEKGAGYSEQQVNRMASEHFERLNMVETNYASQISSLMEQQKQAYRELILRLNEEALLSGNSKLEELRSMHAFHDGRREKNCVPDVSRARADTASMLEESFTIHLGAQQKTMHNLRLMSLDAIDLCRRKSRALEESQRLQMALSLYGGHLHGVVLLVESRAGYHLNFRTDFARACELSTEYHFPDLAAQLNDISRHVVRADECRFLRSVAAQTYGQTLCDDNSPKEFRRGQSLKTGDVYVTRHSNLSQVHIAFHLVADEAVKTQEINSRHPCINGLRNIVRLCYKFDVTTISLPLLLVKTMTEEHTVAWCVKRAELVFKCVKGFMIECTTLSGAAVERYTVQFLVSAEVSADVFHQLSEMLLSIFHLANPVIATKLVPS